jgi:hypothetical protein
MEPLGVYRLVVADLHHLREELDPKVRIEVKIWIRIGIKVKNWSKDA